MFLLGKSPETCCSNGFCTTDTFGLGCQVRIFTDAVMTFEYCSSYFILHLSLGGNITMALTNTAYVPIDCKPFFIPN